MYEGKFNAKSRGKKDPSAALEKILKEREETKAAEAARKTKRPASKAEAIPSREPAAASSAQRPASPAQRTAQQPQRPASPAQRTAQQPQRSASSAQRPAQQTQRPAQQKQLPEQKQVRKAPAQVPVEREPERRGPRLGGIIFYTIYFVMIFAFFIGMYGVLTWLNGWLKDYEAAQPTVKCEEVFDQLFSNPDWAQLYQLAGVEDTEFEGVDQYVEYMTTKCAGQSLNFVETSAGLSGDKKYIVRLGTEKIATFTLEGQAEKITDIPDWQLGKIELFFNRSESLTIRKLEGHMVYVNGVPLDDSYTIQTATTLADEYLPAGTASVRTSIQYIDGLLTIPTLVVYDETGSSMVSVVYNPDSGMYEEQTDGIAISDEERAAVFGALENYAGFMINASGSRAGVAKYFDGSSTAYANIIAMGSELWMNSDRGHTFSNEEILGYTKHSDSLFSVRASLVMTATLKDGTTRDFDVVESMFFTLKNGSWVCYEMMNLDVTQPVGQVRLTFKDSSGNTLSSDFYDTDAESVQCPVLSVPSGQVFSGWCKIDTDSDGNSTWTIVFTPDASGYAVLGSGSSLTPMTLYPLFENA